MAAEQALFTGPQLSTLLTTLVAFGGSLIACARERGLPARAPVVRHTTPSGEADISAATLPAGTSDAGAAAGGAAGVERVRDGAGALSNTPRAGDYFVASSIYYSVARQNRA